MATTGGFSSGRRGLWVFISVVSGIVVFLVVFTSANPHIDPIDRNDIKLPNDSFTLELFALGENQEVKMFDGRTVYLPADATTDQIKKYVADYRRAVDFLDYKRMFIAILKYTGLALVIWLFLSGTLYGFGYSVGWVYRGFRKKS
jgi:hypothetical protein